MPDQTQDEDRTNYVESPKNGAAHRVSPRAASALPGGDQQKVAAPLDS